ncbi:MAG: helix-turn-helix transcriptional regulator [Chroococcus sp. CMT-3BRIN-NPC107]|jgi:AraC-like DNA-binding protein|nr:helix-turn-helix transcriptional regulator [Chroococcus sp. CMT-3BRIN-NPC107]
MSRSAFANCFKRFVGKSPLQYLTRLRMRKAVSLLRNSHDNLNKIAQKVGYKSEAAFNKTFKGYIDFSIKITCDRTC